MTRTHEMIAEQNHDIRALPDREMERRIALGILSGRVIDARKRFRRPALSQCHGGWPIPA